MAQNPNEAQVQSSFPQPPKIYFEQYTNEAMYLDQVPKPPQPIGKSYQMFGQQCHQDDPIIRPLESQNLMRLHPQNCDKRAELKKMCLSIICNFLDLLDILVKAADSPMRDEKLEDLNLLFIHIHHLINEFRPHQARETLKVLMEMQQKQVLEVGERLWMHIQKAETILNKCSENLKEMEMKHYQIMGRDAQQTTSIKIETMDMGSLFSGAIDTNEAIQHESDLNIKSEHYADKNLALLDIIDKIED